ncbi:MAG: hypothetical protein RSE13_05795 [Planktothrix sp. GU0601_MAG3]|nr:MAG: hypothetical protein RSE13_05795 [Planktothrix sp. GU0601_MAG3]
MSKQGKQDDRYQTSENFQIEIGKALTQLYKHTPNLILINNLVEGVTRLIPSLLKHPEQVEVAVWLLKLPNGLWSWSYSKFFIPNLEHYLISMPNFARGDKKATYKLTSHDEWNQILEKISYFWKKDAPPKLEDYKPLADLFEKLEKPPKLAALFSHIAYGKGEVPKQIFSKLANRDGWYCDVYGVNVEGKVTFLELLFLLLLKKFEIGGIDMRVGVALAILLVTFSGGLAIGRVTADKQPETPQPSTTSKPSDGSDQKTIQGNSPKSPTPSATQSNKPPADFDEANAVTEFDQRTKVAIEDIIKKAEDSGNNLAKQQIMQILGLTPLTYDSIKDTKLKTKWVEAIYNYQKNNSFNGKPLKADGIIDTERDTAKKIQEKLNK